MPDLPRLKLKNLKSNLRKKNLMNNNRLLEKMSVSVPRV
jgi:hypothetical protein